MLTFEEAQRRVLGLARELGGERAPLDQAAGRVLAEDVRAPFDSPAFDASTMDGYAVRAAEVGGDAMPVVGESRAGGEAPELAAGAACRIFTGAPMPRGADAVIMQEEADRDGERVRFRTKPRAGAFVRRRGDDLRAGEVALPKGTRVAAPAISLLASLDMAEPLVARAPRVAIVPTGDELREPGTSGGPASIPESNSRALAAMAARAGARVTRRAPVDDDEGRARAAFESALADCDVLVTIGGVSVGEHDVVKGALEACGVSLDFWRVAIKPGKPLAVGVWHSRRPASGESGDRGATIVIGLPGNPVSALVTFALFGVPLLRAMQGDAAPLPRTRRASLAAPLERKAGRLELARARLEEDGRVRLVPNQGSAAVVGLCRADVLACIPRDVERMSAGDAIDVYPLEELAL